MTPDELKIMPKDTFIVTRTGVKPMKTILRLFFKWGIELEETYQMPKAVVRKVIYADKNFIEAMIDEKYQQPIQKEPRNMKEMKIKEITKNIKT